MVSHMGRVHQNLGRGVLLVVLGHDGVLRVRVLVRRVVDPRGRRARVDGGLVLLLLLLLVMRVVLLVLGGRFIRVLRLLALLGRVRVLA